MKPIFAFSLFALPLAIAATTGSAAPAEAKKLGRVTLPAGSVTPPPTVVRLDTRYHRYPSVVPRSRDASNAPGGVTVDVTRTRRW